jgi:hypothetical protein
MGGEVVWWVVVLVLTCLAPLLLLLFFQPTPLPSLLISNPPHSPLIGWVSPPFVVGCVLVADERDTSTCRVWRSFKLRPFSIAILIFIVAYLTVILKS